MSFAGLQTTTVPYPLFPNHKLQVKISKSIPPGDGSYRRAMNSLQKQLASLLTWQGLDNSYRAACRL